MTDRRRMAGLVVALSAFVMGAQAASDVPFLAADYDLAAQKPENPGLKATVTMTSLGTGTKPKVVVAQGALAMEGDLLGGRLPMTFDDASAVPAGQHSLYFTVSKSGRIGLQWLLNDKPLNGKPMQAFDTDVTDGTLTKKLTWNGVSRLVTVAIERKLIMVGGPIVMKPKKPFIIGGVVKITPTPTPKPFKPIIVGGIKLAPKGRNVKVTARFVVTNSDDGVGGIFGNADKSVEMGGYVMLGDQTAFDFNNKSASAGDEFKSKAMKTVALNYSDPDYRFFQVKGNIYDKDKASAPDTMWVGSERIDLIKIMDSGAEYKIRGDHNSESGDLYIRVTDEGEFR